MIEHRLEQRLAAFQAAVGQGADRDFLTRYPESKMSAAEVEPSAWGRVEAEASRDPFAFLRQGGHRRHHFLQSNQMNIILAALDPGQIEALVLELKRTGYLPENRDFSRNTFLRSLGMVALSLPPLAPLIQGLRQFRQVALVGDGDAVLRLQSPKAAQPAPFHMAGFEALTRTLGIDPDGWRHCLVDLAVPVKIAVLDSGVDPRHPDFRGRIVAAKDFSAAQLGAVDPAGHGTHVAGILVGYNATQPRFAGVAPTARVLDAQVMEPQGYTTVFQVLLGMEWALEAGADLLNFSFGHAPCAEDTDLLEWRAVSAALRLGVLSCAAAGNEAKHSPPPGINCPADCPDALCVGAIDATLKRADFSNQGPAIHAARSGLKPDLAAPGVGVVSARARTSHAQPWQGDPLYAALDGTSMAVPMITGILAVALGWLRSQNRGLEAPILKKILLDTCRHPAGQPDFELGRGLPHLTRFFKRLANSGDAPKPARPPRAQIAVPPEPPLLRVPDLRRAEQDLFRYWTDRIERCLHHQPSCLGARGPLSVTWQATNQEARLNDLRLRHQVDGDHLRRLPLLRRAEALVTSNSLPVGRIVCQFLADLDRLCRNHPDPVPAIQVREAAATEWDLHRIRWGAGLPLHLAFAGDLLLPADLADTDPSRCVVLRRTPDAWIYHGPAAYDTAWQLFHPLPDPQIIARLERYLDDRLVGAELADEVARTLELPVDVVLVLGRRLPRHSLEQRGNVFAFLKKKI